MNDLLSKVRACNLCKAYLPLGPRPIIAASKHSKIVLVSQAPGRKAHEQNKAYDDPSGRKLRDWLGVDEERFYDPDNFAILPMGFCYPGKAKTGDKPPRPECAPLWHDSIWEGFENVRLTILIGKYAQDAYLGDSYRGERSKLETNSSKMKLTQNVANYADWLPKFFPIPHPSPVNRFWTIKNPWFEVDVVPELRNLISQILRG